MAFCFDKKAAWQFVCQLSNPTSPDECARLRRGSARNRKLFLQLLFVIQACIIAIKRQQFLVSAELDNPSLIQHGDPVGVAHSRDPMRNQNRGAARGIGVQII